MPAGGGGKGKGKGGAAAAAATCGVCAAQPPKYKCPGCGLRYCSVACCQAHKAAPCPGKAAEGTAGVGAAGGASRKRGREDQRHGGSRFHHQHQHPPRIEDDGDEGVPVLTDEMRRALQESKWLRTALADSTLRSLLTEVDSHRDRPGKLREALAQYPDFQGFVDRLLLEVGALKYEDGRLVFV